MALNSITPAQHVVLGSCHLHQEIQFIGNDVLHMLSFREYLDGYIKNAAPREETLAKLRQYIIELDEAIGKK